MIDLERLHQDLVWLETTLWNTLDTRLRENCDLPITSFLIMRFLAQHPGRRIRDIAQEFAITAGGTSKVIDRIEAAGHCRRHPHPNDRRSSIIELTPGGQDVTNMAVEVFEAELQRHIGSAASEQSLAQFAATLRTLRATFPLNTRQAFTDWGP